MEASNRPMTAPPGPEDRPVDTRAEGNPRPVQPMAQDITISVGGPWRRAQQDRLPRYSAGWNAGDIDFKDDGSIFIRNPYLADAIEDHLMKYRHLKIVRDEGWSGKPTNIAC